MIKKLVINREWAMPNKNTFSIKPINLLKDTQKKLVIDPFCNNSVFKDKCVSNDIIEGFGTDYNLEALEFFKLFKDNSLEVVLFDPPYSPRQVSECYKKADLVVNMQTTQSSFWTKLKKEVERVLKPEGLVITCCWNSGGIGKTNGFEIQEILLVPHGGWHNDTIITVEKKL